MQRVLRLDIKGRLGNSDPIKIRNICSAKDPVKKVKGYRVREHTTYSTIDCYLDI